MTSIQPGFSRVPNLLMSRGTLASLSRTSVGLYQVQQQLSTGQRISRPGEDAVAAATVSILDARLERSAQILRNLDHASSSLSSLDVALGELSNIVNEGKQIASEQVNSTSDTTERAAQANVVNTLLQSLLSVANRTGVQGHLFGGSTPGTTPISSFFGGYRFNASGPGLLTDLGLGAAIPITQGEGSSVGSTSARVAGLVDLEPGLVNAARLTELGGARGLGVSKGVMQMRFDGGPVQTIDLSSADTIGHVATQITAAIRQYETAQGVTILGPGGVSLDGESLSFDIVPGPPPAGPDPELEFSDIGSGVMAKDLGLASDTTPLTFSATAPSGLALSPQITWTTPLSALAGLDISGSGTLGTIRVSNAGRTAEIDLSSATNLQDIRNAIENAGLGLRVQLNPTDGTLDVLSEVSGSTSQSLSITDTDPGNPTATRLGIRTFSAQTPISDMNGGRGVRIVHNQTDPISGLPDPARDVDFRIALGDVAGTVINVDLRPEDMTTVQATIDRINSQIADGLTAAGYPTTTLSVSIGGTDNGLVLSRTGTFASPLAVEQANNSGAAHDLGLIGGSISTDGATLTGEDRAKVRVDSLFSALLDLREALLTNDTAGIAIAGQKLESFVGRVANERAIVGGNARRVDQELLHQESRTTVDLTTRSQLIDTDYAEASLRLSLLQTQLTAGLQTAASTLSRSLLDYLG
ncbi:flagellin N-terminal helical domain-containing protein [Nodularia spumigena]|uniref:flagellin N-terminal helical domain-containing protein n=1 Tax=Nodularia spumigena TaxID=70799 RepID=UPI002B1F1816|nr:hypothetical protein [Nodularia spumigena]MEA5557597.1 hypothetical protein [Nodularia spumigena CH309]